MTLSNWTVLAEEELIHTTRGLKVSCQRVQLPSGREVADFYQIQMASFVVIYALTGPGDVICLRQYKHGVRETCLTLPGGIVENAEPPAETAKRELVEETGYVASEWHNLGRFVLNGNQRIAEAYVFLGLGASKVAEPDSGDLEEMQPLLIDRTSLDRRMLAGELPILAHTAAVGLAGRWLALRRPALKTVSQRDPLSASSRNRGSAK